MIKTSGRRPLPVLGWRAAGALVLRWIGGFAALSKIQRTGSQMEKNSMNEADSGAIEERLARLERGFKRGKHATTVSSTRATRGPS